MQKPSSIARIVIFFKAVVFNWGARNKTPSYQEYEAMATILLAHGMPRKAKSMAEKGEMVRRAWRERNHDPLFEALFAILIAKAEAQMGQIESARSHSIRPGKLLERFYEQAQEETDNSIESNSMKFDMYKKVEQLAEGLGELHEALGDQEKVGHFMSIKYEVKTILKLNWEWNE